ncbi:transcriptional regulator [Candidatus Pacearchaeota archaeon]|nr:transcriptional regulator [Candidatus Pacearchaeota archaeon]MBI2056776.1 transcriptional regulator [Candidatus Pacearchaeota archaeon]
MNPLPQELEIWYLIPALRRELTKIFISDFKFSQKQISKILGITESAVSQYLSSKRGNELKFSKKEIREIKKTAKKIIKSKKANEEFYKLCIKLRGTESLCKLHRKHDKNISKNCDLCNC